MLRTCQLARCAAASTAARHDVVVSGGGIVGLAALRGLQLLSAHLNPPVAAALDEKHDQRVVPTPSATGDAASAAPATAASPLAAPPQTGGLPAAGGWSLMLADAGKELAYSPGAAVHQVRTVAVTPMSSRILDNLGVWGALQVKHPYYRMAIRHETASSAAAAGASAPGTFFNALRGKSTAPLLEFTDLQNPMGYICLNDEVQWRLAQEAAEFAHSGPGSTAILHGAVMENVRLPSMGSAAPVRGAVRTSAGAATSEFVASLLVGCDGGASPLRGVLGSPSFVHDYAQHGFVCSVEIEFIDDGNMCCFQNFFENGDIVAFLPSGPRTANVVFSTASKNAAAMRQMPSADLVACLNARLHAFAPADIPRITAIVSDAAARAVGAFPLRLVVATHPAGNRLMLVGDAAHAVHPMAGQGLNLGLYDVAALVDQLRSACRNGEDIGSPVVGERFAAQMLLQTAPVIGAMEAIKTSVTTVPQLACLGMAALDAASPLKAQVARFASGAHLVPEHPSDSLLFCAD